MQPVDQEASTEEARDSELFLFIGLVSGKIALWRRLQDEGTRRRLLLPSVVVPRDELLL
jgi:hypothetical protein